MLKELNFIGFEVISTHFDLGDIDITGKGKTELNIRPDEKILLEQLLDENDQHTANVIKAEFLSSLKGYKNKDEVFSITLKLCVRFTVDKDIEPTQEDITNSEKIITQFGEQSTNKAYQQILSLTPLKEIVIPTK